MHPFIQDDLQVVGLSPRTPRDSARPHLNLELITMPPTPHASQTRTRPPAGAPTDPWIQRLVWLMEESIPAGRWSFGLDPLIGLIPGFGDLVGATISLMIVARAVSSGVPRVAVARMVANIAIDAALGAIPFAGDAFDFAFKANRKNLKIYEQSLRGDRRAEVRHWAFFAALAAGLALVLALLVAGIITVLGQFGKLF